MAGRSSSGGLRHFRERCDWRRIRRWRRFLATYPDYLILAECSTGRTGLCRDRPQEP